jgi:hypothetical protein
VFQADFSNEHLAAPNERSESISRESCCFVSAPQSQNPEYECGGFNCHAEIEKMKKEGRRIQSLWLKSSDVCVN